MDISLHSTGSTGTEQRDISKSFYCVVFSVSVFLKLFTFMIREAALSILNVFKRAITAANIMGHFSNTFKKTNEL